MATKNSLRVHLMVSDPEGPIHSGPGGTTFKVGRVGNWRIACDPKLTLDDNNRASGEPWAVHCADCFKTDEFKAVDRPKPGEATAAEGVAPEDMNPRKR